MKLTIFTPTYNRSELLDRLYQSLLRQTSFIFEWLVIDDGSTDNTKKVVQRYLDNGSFPVRYYRKKNGGKHTAHNMAVELAQGEYCMCLDSDDMLADGAMESLARFFENVAKDEGVIAYKVDENGIKLSNTFPPGLDMTTTVDLTIFQGCDGEFTLIYPTALLRENLFPVFDRERFITESVLYDRLSKICQMRLLSKVICVCEYRNEGYSNNLNKIMKDNPAGYCLYFMQRIDLQKDFKSRLIHAGKYRCFCWFAGKKETSYNGNHRLLVHAAFPLGILFGFYYKLFRNF